MISFGSGGIRVPSLPLRLTGRVVIEESWGVSLQTRLGDIKVSSLPVIFLKRKKWVQWTVGQYHSWIKASFLPLSGVL